MLPPAFATVEFGGQLQPRVVVAPEPVVSEAAPVQTKAPWEGVTSMFQDAYRAAAASTRRGPGACVATITAAGMSTAWHHGTKAFEGDFRKQAAFDSPKFCPSLPHMAYTGVGYKPDTLAPGFTLVPTPPRSNVSNFVQMRGGSQTRQDVWRGNLYGLHMSDKHSLLIGRLLRVKTDPEVDADTVRLLELTFCAYSIRFTVDVLSRPGVSFAPMFVAPPPGMDDKNYWARLPTDEKNMENSVPDAPPGAFVAFQRLPGKLALKPKANKDGSYSLKCKEMPEHPVIQGATVFDPLPRTANVAWQDGGVGYLMYRPLYSILGEVPERGADFYCAQPVVLYCRLAFGKLALASYADQTAALEASYRYALFNTPTEELTGTPYISLHPSFEIKRFHVPPAELSTCVLQALNVVDVVLHTMTRWVLDTGVKLEWPQARIEARCRIELVRYLRQSGLVETIDELKDRSIEIEIASEDLADQATNLKLLRSFRPEEVRTVLAEVMRAETIAATHVDVTQAATALYSLAPPDVTAYAAAGVDIMVLGLVLSVRTGAHEDRSSEDQQRERRRIASDLVTRFMWDMMIFNHEVSVTPSAHELFLSLKTDKAPGLLNVGSAEDGTPIKETKTSVKRQIKNPHEALTPAAALRAGLPPNTPLTTEPFTVANTPAKIPALPRTAEPRMFTPDEITSNPLLKKLIKGEVLPMDVSGGELSMYHPKTKCSCTEVSGTCHCWPVFGALLRWKIYVPKSIGFPFGLFDASVTEAQRELAEELLHGPLFNASRCGIAHLKPESRPGPRKGFWSEPGAACRAWDRAYGVDVRPMHHAKFWLLYPATVGDYQQLRTLDIWRLKQACEAYLLWMARNGRLIRDMLNFRKRKVRGDYHLLMRNYVTCLHSRCPDAPIEKKWLSAYNTFKFLIVGTGKGDHVTFGSGCKEDNTYCRGQHDLDAIEARQHYRNRPKRKYRKHKSAAGAGGDGDELPRKKRGRDVEDVSSSSDFTSDEDEMDHMAATADEICIAAPHAFGSHRRTANKPLTKKQMMKFEAALRKVEDDDDDVEADEPDDDEPDDEDEGDKDKTTGVGFEDDAADFAVGVLGSGGTVAAMMAQPPAAKSAYKGSSVMPHVRLLVGADNETHVRVKTRAV